MGLRFRTAPGSRPSMQPVPFSHFKNMGEKKLKLSLLPKTTTDRQSNVRIGEESTLLRRRMELHWETGQGALDATPGLVPRGTDCQRIQDWGTSCGLIWSTGQGGARLGGHRAMRQTEGHSLHHELLSGAEYKSQGKMGRIQKQAQDVTRCVVP